MIRISDKSKCCGCTACMNACPVQCIVMRRDREGFDYPVANPDICIGCGKCERVCPVLNPCEPSAILSAYAFRDEKYVQGSSSGGAFPRIAEKVIADGGVVFGAVMNEDLTVGHSDARDMEGVLRMCGSKYVQSDLYATFEEVREQLADGNRVMYTGTPCQIAGLRSYLGDDTGDLLTVDCACHGVPGPGLWEKYLTALKSRHGGSIDEVRFRDKSRSWMHYDFVYRHGDEVVRTPYMSDPFMALFVQNMTLRPSCYNCPVKKGRSGADITLADMWSVMDTIPEMGDDRGVSLVIANTEKGQDTLSGMHVVPVDADRAMRNNGGFTESVAVPERRHEFFVGHHSAKDLIRYMEGFVVKVPLHMRILRKLRRGLSRIKRRIMG